jgi:ribosomal protein L37E
MTEPPWLETNRIMLGAGFSPELIRESQIWAAKHQRCRRCGAQPYEFCKNLTAVGKVGWDKAAPTKFPHSQRIDFDKLKQALIDRGYAK